MGQYSRKVKKGARWFFSGQYLGKKYHSKAIYLTKKECAAAERDKLKELDLEARNPRQDVKIFDLFNHRLDYLKLTRNQEYYRDNQRLCKQIIREWGDIPVSAITKKMAADLILKEAKRCQKEKLSNARPNTLLNVLKASINYAIAKFDVDIKNPCLGISKLPQNRKIKFIPSEEMISAVKEKCNSEQRLLIQFVYETAARINEAVNLDYRDIHEKHIVLYTKKSHNSDRVPRFVPRPDFIRPGGWGKVFKEWNAYPRFLEEKIQELGQERWNWHGLRHRRASVWAHEDMPLFQLQMLLGHSQISTTQRYLHSLGIIKL